VNTGLGVGVALHADSLARAFASAGVGLGALAAHREAAQMADAPVAFDALEALQIHAQFAAKIAFDDVFAVLDGVHDLGDLLLVEVFRAERGINLRVGEDDLRVDRPEAVDVAQGDVNALFAGNFHSNDACHKMLSLPLLVPRVGANDANDALAADNLAIVTELLH
jgi:hypothetical protein